MDDSLEFLQEQGMEVDESPRCCAFRGNATINADGSITVPGYAPSLTRCNSPGYKQIPDTDQWYCRTHWGNYLHAIRVCRQYELRG